jgi:agmatine deiminase
MNVSIESAEHRYAMPAEWVPHERCWMAWPCRERLWRGELDAARRAFAEVATTIGRYEPVTMLARPDLMEQAIDYCGDVVDVTAFPMDDSWMRDTGPTFVRNSEGVVAGCDWRFNGWGGKETPHDADAGLAGALLAELGLQRFASSIVMEGGAIHVDGRGTLLTTDSVLLNKNRNPSVSRADMAEVLRGALGAEKIIWLAGGLAGDMTDGHVDNVVCFVRPGVVLAQICSDADDPNYEILQENRRILDSSTDVQGQPLTVLSIEQPDPVIQLGERLALSYVNFYIANGGVVMPAFSCPQDADAYATVAAAFPRREVVQIDARVILKGGGGIHCITQQQPAAQV